jgi:hypothetical protein
MKKDITELFVFLDDFCNQYELFLQTKFLPENRKLTRIPNLHLSEIMTIVLLFYYSTNLLLKILSISTQLTCNYTNQNFQICRITIVFQC